MAALANAWSERGWEIEILTTHGNGEQTDYPLDPNVRHLPLATTVGPGRQIRIIRDIRRHISHRRPDFVVSFLVFTNILVLMATAGLGIPVFISERLDPRVKKIGKIWHSLRRLTYPLATRLIAQTPTAARLFEPWVPGRVRVIPNPVFPQAEQPGQNEIVHFDRPTILCMGRLMWQKGFDIALEAVALLPASCNEWQLIVLGEGPLRQDLEAQRNRLGLTNRVQFQGRVKNPWPWLRAADLFLLPSRTEGFPNALCEAMAAGLPVASTDCPSGPADIIQDGTDGILIPVSDPAAMATALADLIGSEEKRAGLGSLAPRIVDRFSLSSVLELWDHNFAEISKINNPDLS
ncbi:MAG: glycosyltransferase family 4 protein [Gemmatimonadales bacterium]|nr:glycosyltransferase family 4 protein [Gemmatimonadales bacterium]